VEGNLRDTPLSSVLELIHLTRQSGRVQITGVIPLSLTVVQGEIVGGGILDWQGLEALQSFELHAQHGAFRFAPSGTQVMAQFNVPFASLMTDWARVNDEWTRIRTVIDSPSRVLEFTGAAQEPPHLFQGGKSIRTISRTTKFSAFDVATRAVPLVRSGELRLVDRYAWMGLRMQHPSAAGGRYSPLARDTSEIPMMLDGKRNLAELIEWGFPIRHIRHYLLQAISGGEVQVPGGGWLLRDLTWELEALGEITTTRF
jgi:Domain of unknown function (DUF4388)